MQRPWRQLRCIKYKMTYLKMFWLLKKIKPLVMGASIILSRWLRNIRYLRLLVFLYIIIIVMMMESSLIIEHAFLLYDLLI